MARIRTIKPEFWTHEGLSAVSETACLLAIALLNHADDEGFFSAHPGLIKAACFPIREPSVSIHGALTELSNVGYLMLGKTTDGRSIGKIINFAKHQAINRPSRSKYGDISICWEPSVSPHGTIREPSLDTPTRNREQGTGNREIDSSSSSDDGDLFSEPNHQKPKPAKPDHTQEFAEFWMAYPRRVGKSTAEKAYQKARASADAQTILAHCHRYAEAQRGKDPQYIAHAATWLNQRRWEDEDAPPQSACTGPRSQWDVRLEAYRLTGRWAEDLNGPPPGSPGCLVPADILRHHGYGYLEKTHDPRA